MVNLEEGLAYRMGVGWVGRWVRGRRIQQTREGGGRSESRGAESTVADRTGWPLREEVPVWEAPEWQSRQREGAPVRPVPAGPVA